MSIVEEPAAAWRQRWRGGTCMKYGPRTKRQLSPRSFFQNSAAFHARTHIVLAECECDISSSYLSSASQSIYVPFCFSIFWARRSLMMMCLWWRVGQKATHNLTLMMEIMKATWVCVPPIAAAADFWAAESLSLLGIFKTTDCYY